MAEYLPPIKISGIFNVDNYNYQEEFIAYKEADHRYLRPIQKLNKKTTGISYIESNSTTNITRNLNVSGLVNTIDIAIRNDVAIGESIAISGNIVCGKNITNSGNIYCFGTLFTKKIVIENAIIQNTNLSNTFIDDVPISSQSISFISRLTSDVQSQIDKKQQKGDTGDTGLTGMTGQAGIDGSDGATGDTGLTGMTGQAGIDGIDGTDGATGMTGQAGIDGSDGATGDTGLTGMTGQAGINGIDGTDGATGMTGQAGIDGSDGATGDTGLTGMTGQAGIDGSDGATGDTGLTGMTGQAGIDGSDGVTGDTGLTGMTGQAGIDGSDGATGQAGVDGIDGKDGLNSTLAGYFLNNGVGAFPIYASMNNFADYGMNLFIKSENDGFLIMPSYQLVIYSEINKTGKNITLSNPPSIVISSGSSSGSYDKIQYFKISDLFRAKSCELKKYNINSREFETVNTENITNPEKTWN
jgi:hypothetical protein